MDWKLLVLCVMCILVIGGCIYTVVVETKSYQKGLNNKEEIENIIKAVNEHIEQGNIRYASLDKRIEKLEPKPYTIIGSTPVNNSVYVRKADTYSKEKIEEIVDYKVENELLKKEIEEYKRLIKNEEAAFKKAYSDLLQEKIDKRDWEYLGGKKK